MKSVELHMNIICNNRIVDYLELTFNLNGGSYNKPYSKSNKEPLYV